MPITIPTADQRPLRSLVRDRGTEEDQQHCRQETDQDDDSADGDLTCDLLPPSACERFQADRLRASTGRRPSKAITGMTRNVASLHATPAIPPRIAPAAPRRSWTKAMTRFTVSDISAQVEIGPSPCSPRRCSRRVRDPAVEGLGGCGREGHGEEDREEDHGVGAEHPEGDGGGLVVVLPEKADGNAEGERDGNDHHEAQHREDEQRRLAPDERETLLRELPTLGYL